MSMKSFDKFCEMIITGEPAQEKAVYDERQKVIRLRNTAIALCAYSGLAFVNTLLFDVGVRWCESAFAALVLFIPLCLVLFFVLCAAKGALFDTKGTRSMKYKATIFCFYGALYSVFFFSSESSVLVQGTLSDDFVMMTAAIAFLAEGIILRILCAREDKRAEKEKQD